MVTATLILWWFSLCMYVFMACFVAHAAWEEWRDGWKQWWEPALFALALLVSLIGHLLLYPTA